MNTIWKEIKSLRDAKDGEIDRTNRNRYSVVFHENDGSRTAYCFGVPIYNEHTLRLVDLQFCCRENTVRLQGSNAEIRIGDVLEMQNKDGSCRVSLPGELRFVDHTQIYSGTIQIRPTTNGVLCRAACLPGESVSFRLWASDPFLGVRANDKCVALMQSEFRPFLVVSCLGTVDASGGITAPAMMSYRRLADGQIEIVVRSTGITGTDVVYEINLYEEKLFQDTTVESGQPDRNNAFGTTAYLGMTSLYGEQWLYSRFDVSKLSDLPAGWIDRVRLHIPELTHCRIQLSAFPTVSRFCSFGSVWNNRVGTVDNKAIHALPGGYRSFDMTDVYVNAYTGRLMRSVGTVIRATRDSGFCTVSTGDSHYAPQILEIHMT